MKTLHQCSFSISVNFPFSGTVYHEVEIYIKQQLIISIINFKILNIENEIILSNTIDVKKNHLEQVALVWLEQRHYSSRVLAVTKLEC